MVLLHATLTVSMHDERGASQLVTSRESKQFMV